MGLMRILDQTGDTVVAWAAEDTESVSQAHEAFQRERCRGHLAFARPSGAPASEATQIKEFDPTADEIIWIRPVQGG